MALSKVGPGKLAGVEERWALLREEETNRHQFVEVL